MDTKNEKLMLHRLCFKPIEDNKNSFSELIKYHRYHSRPNKKLSTKDLAKRVGIGPEIFRKIINMQKPTKKRDCIIAICAVLKMNIKETNKALNYYNNMPLLDYSSPRDNLLMTILEYQKECYLDLDSINALLTINNYSSLDTINSRGISKTYETQTSYHVEDVSVNTYLNDECLNYKSLSSRYRFSNYQYEAKMIIKDDHHCYTIYIMADKHQTIYKTKNHIYTSLKETGLFKPCFIQLLGMIEKEKKRIKEILNDTRNYNNRLNGRVVGNHFYVYEEVYEHEYPELNIYYLMEYIDGTYHFSISHESQFLSKHLTNYKEYYIKEPDPPYASFNSLEEIESYENKTLLELYKKRYKEMMKDIQKGIQQIKNKEIYIECKEELDGTVLDYYNIDSLFLEESMKEDPQTLLTLDEIERAYELGYKSIEDIISAKQNYGNIESIIA